MRWWVLRRGAPLAVLVLVAMTLPHLAALIHYAQTVTCPHGWWMLLGCEGCCAEGRGASALSTEVVAWATKSLNIISVFSWFENFSEMYGFHQEILQKTVGTGTFSPHHPPAAAQLAVGRQRDMHMQFQYGNHAISMHKAHMWACCRPRLLGRP